MTQLRPVLVLVHGYLGGAAYWRDQVARFRGGYDVIAPDLPGFGARCDETAPDAISGFADDVLAQLDRTGVDQFMLVGHSMGGMIVQEMAVRVPARIRRLVLYGTGPVGALPERFEPISTSRARIIAEGTGPTIRRICGSWFLHGEAAPGYAGCIALARRVSLQAALAGLTAMEHWDGRQNLSNIAMPTLVLWGDRDRSYGWPQPEALWRGIAGASLAVVPGSAHNVHQEKPAIFDTILADFLQEVVA